MGDHLSSWACNALCSDNSSGHLSALRFSDQPVIFRKTHTSDPVFVGSTAPKGSLGKDRRNGNALAHSCHHWSCCPFADPGLSISPCFVLYRYRRYKYVASRCIGAYRL